MASLKSPRVVTILVLLMVFILGLLTGWSLNAHSKKSLLGSFNNLDEQLNTTVIEQQVLRKMRSKLNLNDQQVQEIRPILMAGIVETVQLRNEALIKLAACRNKYLDQIKPHLPPEQQENIRRFQQTKDAELKEQLSH